MKRFYFLRLIPIAAILLGYNWSVLAQTSTFTAAPAAIQTYTVPAGVTSIKITATGAQGGMSLTPPGSGGHGATLTGIFTVTPGQVLDVIVGAQPATVTKNAGGGGGSFVWDPAATAAPFIVAGGGGGAGFTANGIDAMLTNDGTNGGDGVSFVDAGTGGNGGVAPIPLISFSTLGYGAGGCGWLSNGANGYGGLTSIGIVVPLAMGGKYPLYSTAPGAGGAAGGLASAGGGAGGFGGGGGGEVPFTTTYPGGGGGGGGYSGGGGGVGASANGGGGGGSYFAGSLLTSSVSTGTGSGQVVIAQACEAGIITGNSALCVGFSEALNDTPSGGTWISVNTAIATVDGSGNVHGVAGGNDTIFYVVTTSCGTIDTARAVLTVNSPTGAGIITGTPMVCEGTTTVLSDTLSGGTWSASNTNASVVGGTVTGAIAGTTTITYTNSCGLGTTSVVVTINPTPSAGSISGLATVCVGSAIVLTDAATGGSWSASNTHASVVSGTVSGATAGVDVISYSITGACGVVYATQSVTVTPLPTAGSITGLTSVCTGSSITLTDAATGGTWSASNTNASVTGLTSTTSAVAGVTAGTDVISYTVSNSCGSAYATSTISIVALPTVSSISGLSTVCIGSSITLTDLVTGGSWTAANTNASVSGGTVTGVAAGTDVITYSITNSCGTATATQPVTITPTPSAGTISGPSAVCAGSSIVLTDAATGGSWSAGSAAASVTGGTVTAGAAAGSVTITYSVANSCGTSDATQSVTISTMPTGGTITGTDSVCIGSSVTLADATTGGAWSSSNTKASVSGGVVSGATAGLDTVIYTVTNVCGSAQAKLGIKVKNCTAEVNTTNATQLNVYPNPVTDDLNIEHGEAGMAVRLYNMSGQQVYSGYMARNAETISMRSLPAGAYLLQLTDIGGGRTTKMVVKQ